MTHKALVPFFSLLLLASCQKEKSSLSSVTPGNRTAGHDYYHLTKGSYWVYQVFDVDTLNISTLRPVPDSVYCTGDTLLAGKTYHMLNGSYFGMRPWPTEYLLDSASWLTDNTGRHLCSFSGAGLIQATSTDPSGLYTSSFSMMEGTQTITVAAGTFTCVDAQGTYHSLASPPAWTIRYTDRRYSDGIGMVEQTAFFLSRPSHMDRQLLRYHLN
ncbi:MAG TPA: hypothetical protein VNZ86_07625 [Bacteroidia bacterium]|jgi:hypothetical protein|nr:hypothetical protein [Bacteroidia bacterium]